MDSLSTECVVCGEEKKINFCKLWDVYLKSRGVVVHRIDASCVKMMDDSQLELTKMNRGVQSRWYHIQ